MMELGALVRGSSAADPALGWHIAGDARCRVDGLSMDSRDVAAGDLFLCVPGEVTDGHLYGPAAVEAGAVALLVERSVDTRVPEVRVGSVRRAMGHVAAEFHGHPSRELQMVGVTGTNGKTTTVQLVAAALDHAGVAAGTIGTLTGVRTTPEAPHLQGELRAMVDSGLRAVAMEVSSHALVQDRVTGSRFDVGVFTNLSPDHLDFHADLEDYYQAKKRLFDPDLVDHAVVNVDDAHGARLAEEIDVPVSPVSRADAELIAVGFDGSHLRWAGQEITLRLPGHFNIDNALGAAAALRVLGLEDQQIAAGLSAAEPVPGRFEAVPGPERAPTVIVDYSHTPDGIEQVLASVRAIEPSAGVTIVFGCGGDRDATKRPLMGAAAEAGADHVIITSDNPRSEDPLAIIAAAMAGFRDPAAAVVEPDRRAAIEAAIAGADPDDVIVVAGKGSETTQTIGTEVLPFDDRAVAAEILAGLDS